jgi:hypothetical protein
MKKPFDGLAEGLLVSSSRGGKTPVELFLRHCDETKDSLNQPANGLNRPKMDVQRIDRPLKG